MKRVLVSLLLLGLLIGCQHVPSGPRPGRPFELTPIPEADLSMLAGRTICIDAGHGGKWPGAVAPSNDIRESDVNLRVALCLRDRLRDAGANPILTREEDKALDPSSLSRDLSARPALANASKADVFVSIHHNAHIVEGSGKNDLEVYYKRGDDGPSLDLAQCLMYELARRLRQDPEPKRLFPGNYKVLRKAEVPAVLLESSYMTHARNAAFLATGEAADAEAEAIAAGLAQYFALEPPRVASTEVRATALERHHEIVVRFKDNTAIAKETVRVSLDGATVLSEHWLADNALVCSLPGIVSNGAHRATVRARSRSGASFVDTIPFDVARPPSAITITQSPEAIDKNDPVEMRIEARITDSLGLPVADGASVRLEPSGLTAKTHGGSACFYIMANEAPPRVQASCGNVTEEEAIAFGPCAHRSIRVTHAATDTSVPGAVAIAKGEAIAVSDHEGWLSFPKNPNTLHLKCAGYEPRMSQQHLSHGVAEMTPVAGGVLHGKRIVLDPAYGGRSPGATGPTGARASDLAMDVADRAAAMLRAAGATVVLSREGDEGPTDLQRVQTSEQTNANIHVIVSLGAPGASAKALDKTGHLNASIAGFAGHYPGSKYGTRLAECISAELGGIGVVPTVTYIVQQTACPAVWIQPASIIDAEAEQAYRSVAVRSNMATALYRGVLEYFATPK